MKIISIITLIYILFVLSPYSLTGQFPIDVQIFN